MKNVNRENNDANLDAIDTTYDQWNSANPEVGINIWKVGKKWLEGHGIQ